MPVPMHVFISRISTCTLLMSCLSKPVFVWSHSMALKSGEERLKEMEAEMAL